MADGLAFVILALGALGVVAFYVLHPHRRRR
jgi:hypothetical protein